MKAEDVIVTVRVSYLRLAPSAAKPTDAASVIDSVPRTRTTRYYQSTLTIINYHRRCKFMNSQIRVLASICYYFSGLGASTGRHSRRHDHARPTCLYSYHIATMADGLVLTGSTYALKSGSPLPCLAVANARSGWTRTKLMKSPTPTLVKPSASSYPMASSSANKSLCTHVPVLGS